MPLHNVEIAKMLDQTGELLEIQGGNPFRARAYRRAARVVGGLGKSIQTLIAADKDLTELPGIGDDLAAKITAIATTGRFDLLEQLKHELPGDLGDIAALPGVGPKRLKLLYDRLGVRTLDELRRCAAAGRLRDVKGLGGKFEIRLREALQKPAGPSRFRLSVVEDEADALLAFLRDAGGVGAVVAAGSFRRRRETVGDLDILATARDGWKIGDRLIAYENVVKTLAHGPMRTSVELRSGLQVDLRVVPAASLGAALIYFTGSKAHNLALRRLAQRRGWKLNEYGLFDQDHRIAGSTEQAVYRKLGLSYIPSELREDRGEIAAARTHSLPALVSLADIRGDLHVHSNWSDGAVPIAVMAEAARARGYGYIALTDHSQHLAITHGLDVERLSRQTDEIDRLNARREDFTILKGIEVDILTDGTLDLPDSILARLDLVVAAVHSRFDLSAKAQTDRIIRAMDNPHVSIVAHPTGRLIGDRDAYAVDMERLIEAAAGHGCHFEINAEPDRLDLSDLHARAAKAAGVKLAISTDAHSADGLDFMRFGVDQARRGWIEPGDILNTRQLPALRKLLKR
ncbi:DNA polymerase (family 10) [Sphingomonas sp. YR710]|uniref:DNA polymerase/3'-5' exonuclease PolX n=1 Tax=Sphingomonas sp. YR710 TaxID=1882773 RepID=UPI000889EBA9|nr:DNA polymerase/3'-5' exonuclease PolX [Sphingomonas sp. YR710]SDD80378.1 DNA polymerase (family 10) [Sphingomonas sp. YR710]